MDDWLSFRTDAARAIGRIFDVSGRYTKRGEVGAICDYLPNETSAGGYVVVDFPSTGPLLCWPNEICPA